MSTDENRAEPLAPDDFKNELQLRGHIVTSWDQIGAIELPLMLADSNL